MTTKEKLPLLVIIGGIGEFAGITGDIDFVTDLTGTVVSQSYITCH